MSAMVAAYAALADRGGVGRGREGGKESAKNKKQKKDKKQKQKRRATTLWSCFEREALVFCRSCRLSPRPLGLPAARDLTAQSTRTPDRPRGMTSKTQTHDGRRFGQRKEEKDWTVCGLEERWD